MGRFIAKNIGLPLCDFLKRTKIRKYYKLYKKSLQWNRKEIQAYQFDKVKKLIRHSFESVPFYRKRFEEKNLTPDSIKKIEDLQKVGPLTREDLQENLDDLIDENVNRDKLFKSSSSGTTGIPVTYYKDRNSYSADVAAGYLHWYIHGWELGDRSLHVWGNPESIKNWNRIFSKGKRLLLNTGNFPSFLLNNEEAYLKVVNLINKYKILYIDGYTSPIYILAKFIFDNKIKIHRPKKIFTTAENLYNYQRDVIENVLAPVIDCYGCGEINGIAQECYKKNYHIIEPRVIVEEEDFLEGKKVILLTDLENFSMPLIRYKVGDLFEGLTADGKCQCGINYKFFKKLEGRASECVRLPNGKIILPISLFGGTAFRKVRHIIRHQTIWNGEYFIFIFEVSKSFSNEDRKKMGCILKDILKKYKVGFKIEITKELIKTNNKFDYFKVNYDIT
ncbi:MAG: phenylacetate--CoA ligase family protein [Candidatus Aminicenantes bacterium]|nr:MAG: phenylacetate--CoA ligase family protein [Candidatus Aminicenantes bacterium]